MSRWVRWRATDRRRALERQAARFDASPLDPEASLTAEAVLTQPSADAEIARAIRQEILQLAFKRLARRISPRNIQIFELVVFQEVDVDTAARITKSTPAHVYLARHRVTRAFRAEILALSKIVVPKTCEYWPPPDKSEKEE